MSLIHGKPAPLIVIKKDGYADTEIRLNHGRGGFKSYTPFYSCDFIRHPLQDGSVKSKMRFLRYRSEILFDAIEGNDLAPLSRLYHQSAIGDEPGYDQILLYPHAIDMPDFSIEVTVDDDEWALNYGNLLAHREFTLKFLATNQVTWPPLALPQYLILMRNIWSINPAGATVLYPCEFSDANYWIDARGVEGDHISNITRATKSFKAYGSLNGGIARYVVFDRLLDTLEGSKIRVGTCTLGVADSDTPFSSNLISDSIWLDVRSLDGTEISITGFDKSGFTAHATANGTQCTYLAVDPSVTDFEQTRIKMFEVSFAEGTHVVPLPGTAFPKDNYWSDARVVGQDIRVDILSQTKNSITLRNTSEADVTVRLLLVYQEASL